MAGELRMVTWYFRSGRSDAATRRSTVLAIIACRRAFSYSPPYDARIRACSRWFAGSGSAVGEACGIGSVTRRWSVVLVQLASSNNARTAAISLAGPATPVLIPLMPPYSHSLSIGEFDLLGSDGFDHRTGPLLDPATHPDRLTFKPSWINTSHCERPPVALGNGDSKVLRPAPPEV